ncbi:MAG: PD-(D/E)XK nuclease family protein [Clostridia bacterium]|nr:PD-(D/E)XK nuclease family protein [Clostridia bacterium]
MLKLIIGRSGSGKTTELYRRMRNAAEHSTAPLILLVPEQASFDNERRLLLEFGPVLSQRVQVLSFTRMANAVFRQIGGLAGKRMDQTLSMLLMSQALHSIVDSLTLYRRHVDNPEYLRTLLDFLSECKQCTITPQLLEDTAKALPEGVLRSKTKETALIFGAYEALVASTDLVDPQDELTVLGQRLPESTLFDGAHVYLDAFKGFTEQEFLVLDRLMPRVASMTVCLCTDTVTPQDTSGRFSSVARTATRLRDAAGRHHVPVAAVQHLTDNHRTADPALAALEAGCFLPAADAYTEPTDAVCITPCADRAEECRYAAREIRRLLRERGGHCRDFTVVVRNSSDYSDLLVAALQREGLPCTPDLRESVVTQPIITLIESALAAASGWDSADVLRLVKTGLAGFSATSAAQLENYVFLWNIRGKQWKLPFTLHPDGLQADTDDRSTERLERLNQLRRRLAQPLIHLQTRLDGNHTGRDFSAAVWAFLQELRVPRMVRLQVARLKNAGERHAAEQQARLWDYTVSLLDKFATLTVPSTAKQFTDLWHLAVSSDDLGSIPPTLDGVKFGAADRMRYTAPKAVFLLGANEGVFPAYPSTGGLLSDHERRQLTAAGLPMADDADHQTAEERYYAYMAVAAASERLVVTYVQAASGEVQQPSSLVNTIRQILPAHTTGTVDGVGACESDADAFYRLSALWREDSAEAASLRAVCEELPAYAARIRSLREAQRGFALGDPALAQRLFGRDMWVSPSKMDTYHRCRFSYFCKYGLHAYPRERAELNPAQVGTLSHYIMSKLLPVYAKRGYTDCTKDAVRADVDAAVHAYILEMMGHDAVHDGRLRGTVAHLSRFCHELMWRVVCELKNSRFVPVDYELPIGDEDGIPSWELKTTDGGTVRVRGVVDRVDAFCDGDTSYIRIVDYKSGQKTFNLGEVLEGLDMQMLIYLFAICENGAERYGSVSPAGVLYLPAKLPFVNISRELSDDGMDRERFKVMRSNGLLIDDPAVLRAMEPDLAGVFIPVSLLKSGELSKASSLATLEQFGRIRRRIQKVLVEMVEQLHAGAVNAVPIGGVKDACAYCDYHDICCHESTDPVRELTSKKLAEALAALDEPETEVNDRGLDV